MSKIKNLTLILLSIIFSCLVIYILFILYNFIIYKNIENKFFLNQEILEFHKKYSSQLHHTRTTDSGKIIELLNNNHSIPLDELNMSFNKKIKDKNELLYNVINFSNSDNSILIQGDSWAEQFNFYLDSFNRLKNFAEDNNYKVINAGISSFSPSLMNVQFKILESDFKIKPKYVVAYIDQTDVGDELCRYKNNKVFDDTDRLLLVRPDIHEFPIQWKMTELNFSKDNKFTKSFELTNFYFNQYFSKATNKILKYFNKGINYCTYDQIQSYLIKNKKEDISYFRSSLELYINTLLKRNYIDKIILISFPHKQHFNNDKEYGEIEYKFNVSDLIQEISYLNKKITHINFSKEILASNITIKDLWIDNDISSHIKPVYHDRLITKRILEEIQR